MLKIGVSGVHGTGKTTLCQKISENLQINFIQGTMRMFWETSGIAQFEKLPKDIRGQFQKHAILNQITRENSFSDSSFITDRTVLDNLSYTKLSAEISEIDLQIYEMLVAERLKKYTHFIYIPKMFEITENDNKRANLSSQSDLEKIFEDYIVKFDQEKEISFLMLKSVNLEERILEVLNFIRSKPNYSKIT